MSNVRNYLNMAKNQANEQYVGFAGSSQMQMNGGMRNMAQPVYANATGLNNAPQSQT